ncbi:MAG: hypothetical protein ABEJ31_11000 [Haloarculaceae archaeon]
MLLGRLLGVRTGSPGRFVVVAAGLGTVVWSALCVAIAVLGPPIGVERPLTVVPLALTASLLSLATLGAWYYDRDRSRLGDYAVSVTVPEVVAIVVLPGAAVAAALARRLAGTDTGMFLFVGLVVATVALASTRLVDDRLYAALTYAIGLAMLLHRNLISGFVIGADVQGAYAAAAHIVREGAWAPSMGGSPVALPVTTVGPATLSVLTNAPLAGTLKWVAVALFSLVPLGIYYLGSDLFDRRVGFFGAVLFSFYQVSFAFTPGKQLLSELFAVLLLLGLFGDQTARFRTAVGFAACVGLAFAHYGMTFALGLALLAAWTTLAVLSVARSDFEYSLPLRIPVFLIGFAVVWYWLTAPPVLAQIASLPAIAADQVVGLITRGTIEGSGASYVSGQQSLLDVLNVLLYMGVAGVIAVGLAWKGLAQFDRVRRGIDPGPIGYTLVAAPMFAFLAGSFFLVLNLWADRAYQLVLTVLAPFMPLGFRFADRVAGELVDRLGRVASLPAWPAGTFGLAGPAVLVSLLVVFNTGLAAAATGSADTSSFNSQANDLAFNDDEREGVQWLVANTNVTATGTYNGSHARTRVDDPRDVQIYTDPLTYQLFRAEASPAYYNTDLVLLKNRWRPEVDYGRIQDGYVFVRKRAIQAAPAENETAFPSLTRAEIEPIRESGRVVFENEGVTIIEVHGGVEEDS